MCSGCVEDLEVEGSALIQSFSHSFIHDLWNAEFLLFEGKQELSVVRLK